MDGLTTQDGELPLTAQESPIERRRALTCRNNPHSGLDFLVSLEGRLTSPAGRVALRYVPDRLILEPAAFHDYLALLAGREGPNAEDVAVAVLQDINNEVVPRWAQVRVAEESGSGDRNDGNGHRVLVEDRQPNWDNPALLSRLSDS